MTACDPREIEQFIQRLENALNGYDAVAYNRDFSPEVSWCSPNGLLVSDLKTLHAVHAGQMATLRGQAKGATLRGQAKGAALRGQAKGAALRGPAKGAALRGPAKGAALRGPAKGPRFTYNVERTECITDDAAFAHCRLTRTSADGAVESDERCLYVLSRTGGQWQLRAGHNTRIQPTPPT